MKAVFNPSAHQKLGYQKISEPLLGDEGRSESLASSPYTSSINAKAVFSERLGIRNRLQSTFANTTQAEDTKLEEFATSSPDADAPKESLTPYTVKNLEAMAANCSLLDLLKCLESCPTETLSQLSPEVVWASLEVHMEKANNKLFSTIELVKLMSENKGFRAFRNANSRNDDFMVEKCLERYLRWRMSGQIADVTRRLPVFGVGEFLGKQFGLVTPRMLLKHGMDAPLLIAANAADQSMLKALFEVSSEESKRALTKFQVAKGQKTEAVAADS